MTQVASKEQHLRKQLGNDVAVYHLYREGHPYATVAVQKCGVCRVNRAYAYCSWQDNFEKRIGRVIALQRLQAAIPATVAEYKCIYKGRDCPVGKGSPVYEADAYMTDRERRIFYGDRRVQ